MNDNNDSLHDDGEDDGYAADGSDLLRPLPADHPIYTEGLALITTLPSPRPAAPQPGPAPDPGSPALGELEQEEHPFETDLDNPA